jgi:hypothetical protein
MLLEFEKILRGQINRDGVDVSGLELAQNEINVFTAQSSDKELRWAASNIKEACSGVKFLGYSPILIIGVDISLPGFFDTMYAYGVSKTLTGSLFLQLLFRVCWNTPESGRIVVSVLCSVMRGVARHVSRRVVRHVIRCVDGFGSRRVVVSHWSI